MSEQLKILLLDMELSYAIYYAFPSKKPQYLSARQIKNHQFCICTAWKWHHESSKYVIKVTDDKARFKKDFRDDYIIAVKMHELMTEADVIVAHNGDAFDIKHANTLFIKHGLGPIPERKSIDTLKVARKYFNFAGNDLGSLSTRFGGKGKNDKPCWIKLSNGDPNEINRASKYCLNDVNELEIVFDEIKPFIKNFPRLPSPEGLKKCEVCGSKRIQSRGTDFDGKKMYNRVKCIECGHNHHCKIKAQK